MERPATPFFIVGAERSGTTMLRLMLIEHPDVVVPPETWFLIDLMNGLPLTGELGERHKELAYKIITGHERWRDLEIHDAVLRDRLSGLERPCLASIIDAVYAELLHRYRKSRWGDKTPEYVVEIDRLHRVFPAAQFVHVIRDARDVSMSLVKKQWRGTFTVNAARYWSNYVSRGVASGRRLRKGLYLEVRYEDIIRKPESELRRVCAFLNLNYTDSLLCFYERAAEKIPLRERFYHTNTSRPPQLTDIERWRAEATGIQIVSVEGVAGATMDLVGQTRHFRGWSRVMPIILGTAEAALWGALRLRRRIFRRS